MPDLALAPWNVGVDGDGTLAIGGLSTHALADQFGTPLHVINYDNLCSASRGFLHDFSSRYPGRVEVYFAAKCNAVRGVLQGVRSAGLGVEVFTPFELRLAQAAGYHGAGIIVNGPAKTRDFLEDCVKSGVKLIVADSLREIELLLDIACASRRSVDVLLRVNVDYVPRGMSPGAATGSGNSVFGMHADEVIDAVHLCQQDNGIRFRGFHMHIGSGIRRADDYRRACTLLCEVAVRVHDSTGAIPDYFDVGGGFATPMVREFSSLEFLLYHGMGRLPAAAERHETSSFGDFADAVVGPIVATCGTRGWPLPVLMLEPGRCLISSNQLLLLRVLALKRRKGRRDYVLTDGGQMSVNFPTFYERHAILSCRRPYERPARPVDIVGPGCYSADFVSRNTPLPKVEEGDLLAIMDSGAYFLSFEGNFSFPRAGVVAVKDGTPFLLRALESYADMLSREKCLPETGE